MGTYGAPNRLLLSLNLLCSKLKKYKEILLLQERAIQKYELAHVAYYANLEKETTKELSRLYKEINSLEAKNIQVNIDLHKEMTNVRRLIDNLLLTINKKNLRNQKLIRCLVKKLEKDLLSFRQNQAKYLFASSQSSSPVYDVTV